MLEEWKDIKGYEGIYQASNLGRIKSLDRIKQTKGRYGKMQIKIKGVILKASANHDNYLEVVLSKNGKSKTKRVNRIIAETFIENPNNYKQVNHINGVKTDNRVDNLEWCNCKDNIYHALKNNLMKPVKGEKHYKSKKVGKFDKNNNLLEEYDTINNAAKNNNICHTGIVNCLKLRTKTAGGFIWKYME
jgi:hypothetical protein